MAHHLGNYIAITEAAEGARLGEETSRSDGQEPRQRRRKLTSAPLSSFQPFELVYVENEAGMMVRGDEGENNGALFYLCRLDFQLSAFIFSAFPTSTLL